MMSKKINVGNALSNLVAHVKEMGAKWEKLEELVKPIVEPLILVFKKEINDEIVEFKEEVVEETKVIKNKLEDFVSKADFEDFQKLIKNMIDETVSEVMDIGLSLDALAEFDTNEDGILSIPEVVPVIIEKFNNNDVEWSEVVNALLPLALDELGIDAFKQKANVITWFNEKAEEYDFGLLKWTHIYETFVSKI